MAYELFTRGNRMKISIIGAGYVGIPTAIAFKHWGHEVVVVDNDILKIDFLQNGEMPIYEKGFDYYKSDIEAIEFTTDWTKIANSNVVVLCVGTPMGKNGEADTSYIKLAAMDVDKYTQGAVVVVKSTVPVGTCKDLYNYIKRNEIASMPEFLREGYALDDVFDPDRVIIGTPNTETFELLKHIYPEYMWEKIHHIKTLESSEMIKYASNAFLAVKLHYINEMADLCEQVGADVKDVALGMGLDSRIGSKFLNAGCGYGGSCFPKDTNAIYSLAENKGVNLSLVGATIAGNRKRQKNIANKLNFCINTFNVKKVAYLGLAFKNGTDDVRESPAINILEGITAKTDIYAYDPKAMDNAQRAIFNPNVKYANSIEDCLKDAEVLVIATEWKQFADIYDKLPLMAKSDIVNKPIIYDLKNMLDEEKITQDYVYIPTGKVIKND